MQKNSKRPFPNFRKENNKAENSTDKGKKKSFRKEEGKPSPLPKKGYSSRSKNSEAAPPEYDLKKINALKKGRKGEASNTNLPESDQVIRLNKYISNSGVCSRREADKLIEAGEIKVNEQVITELGYKVNKADIIKYGNKVLSREKNVYVLLNKPKDFITTTNDPEDRRTVMQLVSGACEERIYPVGRLDRHTTGLILLTNDGDLAKKLSHPSHKVKKLYQVDIDKPITDEDFIKIQEGVELDDGIAKVDELAIVGSGRTSLGLEIHIGRNRIVRRIFEHLGYKVIKLDRVMYAGLTKIDLPRGKWRFLTEKEVIKLKFLK